MGERIDVEGVGGKNPRVVYVFLTWLHIAADEVKAACVSI